jgi:hypothetical protein
MKLATSLLLLAPAALAFAPQQAAFRQKSTLFSTEAAKETKVSKLQYKRYSFLARMQKDTGENVVF